jgi:hypothetical protein
VGPLNLITNEIIVNPQLEQLIELQKIDAFISSLTLKIKGFPEFLKKEEAALKEKLSVSEKEKLAYEKLLKARKDKETALVDMEDKIKKMKSKSSEVKTNKEYQAFLKEIETFESQKYKIEEDILNAMEAIEAAKDKVKRADKQIEQSKAEFAKKAKAFKNKENELLEALKQLQTKRDKTIPLVEKDIYKTYMTLFQTRANQAVVKVENEICFGCNMNIPPQLFNDVKKGDRVLTCSYCHRILYYSPDEQEN